MIAKDSQDTQGHSEGAPPSPSEVVSTLIATSHRLRRVLNTRLSRESGVIGLSGPRLRLLLAVEEAGQMRMGDLAAVLGVTARTITTLVDTLEKEVLLARSPAAAIHPLSLLPLPDQVQSSP